jgi:hypothetical protein
MANNEYRVNDQAPLGLNLRSAPDPTLNNIKAVIPFGHRVTKLEDSNVANWWQVQVTLSGTTDTGFVNRKFLTPADEVETTTHNRVGAVHLPVSSSPVTRQNARRAQRLTESPGITRDPQAPAAERVSAIRQLIAWLKVESSARYLPLGGSTYCNIYAYDYAYLTGTYLPRVWWSDQAIISLQAGQNVPVQYPGTVNELTANALSNWFRNWGTTFGWRRTLDLNELQDAANDGRVCITVARAKPQYHHGHGHIVAVVPETDPYRALRQGGNVIKTVQSQAGGHNHDYVVQRWWDDGTYADFSHWIHD